MTLFQKAVGVLLTTSMAGTAFAQSMLDIKVLGVPRTAFVSVSADAPYLVSVAITNNLNKSTSISYKSSGMGIDVTYSGCDKVLGPHQSCVMTFGINGEQVQSNFLWAPVFCASGGQLCSGADSSNRIQVIKNTNPIPKGTWKTLATVGQDTFPQFIVIDPIQYQFAIGLTSSNYLPVVIRCSINNIDDCSVPVKGLLQHHFSTLTNLSFDPQGNLYGLFIKSYEDAPWKNETYPMKLINKENTWFEFGNYFSGTAFGLDTSNAQQILISSQQFSQESLNNSIGFTQSLGSAGNSLYAQTFLGASNFGNTVNDGQGHIFVSGPETNPDQSMQAHSKIWQWSASDQTFTVIPMPDDISIITSLVSNGQGVLYASGLDSFSNGRVWQYTVATQAFEDTNLNASYVTTLEYSPYGYLLAGGVNGTSYTGTVWYYSNGQWVDLNLLDSTNVVSISANANNDIFATGFTSQNEAAVWLFNSIDQQQG